MNNIKKLNMSKAKLEDVLSIGKSTLDRIGVSWNHKKKRDQVC